MMPVPKREQKQPRGLSEPLQNCEVIAWSVGKLKLSLANVSI